MVNEFIGRIGPKIGLGSAKGLTEPNIKSAKVQTVSTRLLRRLSDVLHGYMMASYEGLATFSPLVHLRGKFKFDSDPSGN